MTDTAVQASPDLTREELIERITAAIAATSKIRRALGRKVVSRYRMTSICHSGTCQFLRDAGLPEITNGARSSASLVSPIEDQPQYDLGWFTEEGLRVLLTQVETEAEATRERIRTTLLNGAYASYVPDAERDKFMADHDLRPITTAYDLTINMIVLGTRPARMSPQKQTAVRRKIQALVAGVPELAGITGDTDITVSLSQATRQIRD